MMVLVMLMKWIETKHFLIETESSMRSGGPANDAGTDYSEGIIDIILKYIFAKKKSRHHPLSQCTGDLVYCTAHECRTNTLII